MCITCVLIIPENSFYFWPLTSFLNRNRNLAMPERCPMSHIFTGDPLYNLSEEGVLGWVSERDTQHRPLTQIATKGPKGVETIHLSNFDEKGVEIRHFPHFRSNIGVETIQISHRPEKGGSKWRIICSNLHRLSTLPGTRPPIRFHVIIQNNPTRPLKATKLTIITCSAIWYEAQQQCCRLTCNIWSRTHVLFVYLIMYTWLDKFVYMHT